MRQKEGIGRFGAGIILTARRRGLVCEGQRWVGKVRAGQEQEVSMESRTTIQAEDGGGLVWGSRGGDESSRIRGIF